MCENWQTIVEFLKQIIDLTILLLPVEGKCQRSQISVRIELNKQNQNALRLQRCNALFYLSIMCSYAYIEIGEPIKRNRFMHNDVKI